MAVAIIVHDRKETLFLFFVIDLKVRSFFNDRRLNVIRQYRVLRLPQDFRQSNVSHLYVNVLNTGLLQILTDTTMVSCTYLEILKTK